MPPRKLSARFVRHDSTEENLSSLHGLQSGFASKIVVKTDLGVTAHANTTQVKNGDVMVYHIRAVNHGPDPASQATLIVSLVGPHTADRQPAGRRLGQYRCMRLAW
jgi:Domain of unknown function DUF11